MKNKRTARSSLKFLGAPVAALLILSVGFASANGLGVVASATGGYQATYLGDRTRSISFSAVRDAENNVTGQAQFKNLDSGFILHFDVTCLRVEGNVATISGIQSTPVNGEYPFPYFWLQVVDNGQGRQAKDLVSFFVSTDVDPTCYVDVFSPTNPVDVGNIQVR